jgi:hypothetical protein
MELFVERRDQSNPHPGPHQERRQFIGAYDHLTPDARELATAIDAYKLHHRRPVISFEELMTLVKSLGYVKAVGA